MGLTRLCTTRWKRKLMFWHRLVNMEDGRLPKHIYHNTAGAGSFNNSIKNICRRLDISEDGIVIRHINSPPIVTVMVIDSIANDVVVKDPIPFHMFQLNIVCSVSAVPHKKSFIEEHANSRIPRARVQKLSHSILLLLELGYPKDVFSDLIEKFALQKPMLLGVAGLIAHGTSGDFLQILIVGTLSE